MSQSKASRLLRWAGNRIVASLTHCCIKPGISNVAGHSLCFPAGRYEVTRKIRDGIRCQLRGHLEDGIRCQLRGQLEDGIRCQLRGQLEDGIRCQL
ncbi:hypothetical protein Bpfe_020410 [Biomphalaria pfeifferi]|uniref:Uncharacterized protein n=1 Tax=Biomphalaria pfeifferi TaxID=112525 RepID=A0AAD8F3C1_BIOPF|nr:hypothetical protein Bpfe_020410 [Biomphalaria pfeifferi]